MDDATRKEWDEALERMATELAGAGVCVNEWKLLAEELAAKAQELADWVDAHRPEGLVVTDQDADRIGRARVAAVRETVAKVWSESEDAS